MVVSLVLENSQSLFIQDARAGKKVVARGRGNCCFRGSSGVPLQNSARVAAGGNVQIDDKVMTRSHARHPSMGLAGMEM